MIEGLDEFLLDREQALLSLDVNRVNAYLRKYGSPNLPEGEEALVTMHKARTAITTFPEDERALSEKWLADRGYAGMRV